MRKDFGKSEEPNLPTTLKMAAKTKRHSGMTMFTILFTLFMLLIGITAGLTYAGFQSTAQSNGTLSFAVNGHKGQISISNCDVRYDTSTLDNTFIILPDANYNVPTNISTYILTTEPTASNWINAPTGWTLNNTITTYDAGTITVDDLAMISANAKAIYIVGSCVASTYTITYNANGGSGSMSNTTANYGSMVNLRANAFTRTGYTFAGWALSTDGELKYGNQTEVKDIGNTTLYAKWTGNKYLINFDNQGADISMGTIATIVSYGSALPSITIPTRTGYTFSGYYTAINGGGTQYYTASGTSAVSYSQTSNTNLYAKWTAKTYIITYKDGGNTNFSGTHESGYPTTHTYGTATTLKSASKTGYNFGGWFTASGCTGSAVTSLGATAYTNNITLYAKWTAIIYTITIGGLQSGDVAHFWDDNTVNITSSTYTELRSHIGSTEIYYYNDSDFNIINFTRNCYTYNGLYTASSGGSKVVNTDGTLVSNVSGYTNGSAQWNRASNTTLYAQWTVVTYAVTILVYTINYNAQGGTTLNSSQTVYIAHGTSFSVAINGTANTGVDIVLGGDLHNIPFAQYSTITTVETTGYSTISIGYGATNMDPSFSGTVTNAMTFTVSFDLRSPFF